LSKLLCLFALAKTPRVMPRGCEGLHAGRAAFYGPLPQREGLRAYSSVSSHGYAETREAAMSAFAKSWRRE
jgi:hypothetical protein